MSYQEKTSVRVNQTPGGNSSISLGWGENTIYTVGKVNRNESSIIFNDGTKEPLIERRNLTAVVDPSTYEGPVKVPVGGNTSVCFGGFAPERTNTKSRVPPGGKTTFTFG